MRHDKYLSNDERIRLESVLRNSIDTDLRNACLILTALYTGARASEVLSLQWNDINIASGSIIVRSLKGGEDRTIVVPSFIRKSLEALKSLSPERPFAISYSRLQDIWYLYRPVAKKFHSLRHTFGRLVYSRTKDICFTQYTLGHRSLKNTQIYTERDYSPTEFKKLMKVR